MNKNEQNFEELKRLMKLKRFEVPPPGYFNNFSGNVISRIRAGERSRRRTLVERLQSESSWLAGLMRIFDTRPGVIGGFASALCLLMVLGVLFAEYSDRSSQKHEELSASSTPTGNPTTDLTAPGAYSLMAASEDGGITASTNSVLSLQPAGTFFGQPNAAGAFQNASFGTGR